IPPAAATGRGATASTTRGTRAKVETSPATWPPPLDALRDNDIHSRTRRPAGIRDRADLVEDLHARRVRPSHVRRRVPPEEGENGHPLFQADGDLILDREVEKQVHPERLGGERPHAADLLAEDQRWAKLGLQDA